MLRAGIDKLLHMGQVELGLLKPGRRISVEAFFQRTAGSGNRVDGELGFFHANVNQYGFWRATMELLVLMTVMAVALAAYARDPRSKANPAAMKARDTWLRKRLLSTGSGLPFSFHYGDAASANLLPEWNSARTTRRLDALRTETVRTWTDPKTGLEVRCRIVTYRDYPAVEWTLLLKNRGATDTPVMESVQALDAIVHQPGGEFLLHCHKGDFDSPDGYAPFDVALGPGESRRFAPDGGRPTNGPNGWPYYNLQMADGGMMLAVGWPGQWAGAFTRDSGDGLHLLAGQERVHLILKPGEEIRSPLIALLFWSGGDPVEAQNMWRRWMLAHNVPHVNEGHTPQPMAQMQLCVDFNDGEDVMFREMKKLDDAGVHIDLCWRDAGWYLHPGEWWHTGTWEVDPVRFPDGFKTASAAIHAKGRKLIVWFEPERVGDPNSWLAKNHPEWLLGGTLLNLGNKDAWNWLLEHVDGLLTSQGIDYYRQDFNMDPLDAWRSNDAPDRQGMTENLDVQGYLAYWDELRRRHPGMLIDSCASGGRRNDLETLRRAVPLLRSDFQFGNDAIVGNQGQTYGISAWIPYYGSGFGFTDKVGARSFYVPCYGFANPSMEQLKWAYDECRQVAPAMLGDYYPLTAYSLAPETWIAWQFYRPEVGEGVVQAFRREKSTDDLQVFHLKGLDPDATYDLTDLDEGTLPPRTGTALMDQGLRLEITAHPGSAIVLLRRQAGDHGI